MKHSPSKKNHSTLYRLLLERSLLFAFSIFYCRSDQHFDPIYATAKIAHVCIYYHDDVHIVLANDAFNLVIHGFLPSVAQRCTKFFPHVQRDYFGF